MSKKKSDETQKETKIETVKPDKTVPHVPESPDLDIVAPDFDLITESFDPTKLPTGHKSKK